FEGILNHHVGFVVWATIAFLLLLVLLKKFAWRPILDAIHERERSIEGALESAKNAKEEMARFTSQNETLLKEARAERDQILKEAKELKDQIVSDAKKQAELEGSKALEKAKQEIENQKAEAIFEIKNQAASL